jgi:hypothetical protein
MPRTRNNAEDQQRHPANELHVALDEALVRDQLGQIDEPGLAGRVYRHGHASPPGTSAGAPPSSSAAAGRPRRPGRGTGLPGLASLGLADRGDQDLRVKPSLPTMSIAVTTDWCAARPSARMVTGRSAAVRPPPVRAPAAASPGGDSRVPVRRRSSRCRSRDHDLDLRPAALRPRRGVRLRQLQADLGGLDEAGGHHEKHQQQQHHVDQRCQVDLRLFTGPRAAGSCRSELPWWACRASASTSFIASFSISTTSASTRPRR